MNNRPEEQKDDIASATSGTIELGKASEVTRGCLGVVNDFICYMPVDGLDRD